MRTTYDRVRELIVGGAFPPGQRLTEVGLSQRLDVSRTPVREALRQLESDGLVESGQRGVTVVRLGRAALREAYLVRASLEALTADLCAQRQQAGEIAPAALTRLERHADDADRATRAGDLPAGVRHNREFHRHIAVLAGNELALGFLDRVWDRIVVSTRDSLTATGRTGQVDDEHRRLLAAIRAGDGTTAADLARAHVRHTLSTLHEGE
ncbi:GntR family transcriptional regulator [Amycolatopsis thermophila]|uniref:DNA-binding GntR family transcriptional regulator n=1 Tax=Amycolatopsis thermophila TaxID=206084 RepID=A0ABU0F368_9PSEU|nr:GntR family transcriptional regulator [Amycolatopsis thermophila]MDQ0382020.1 DNA-binding GntR family transcriptional regulator [Amycolatopsis thermophila]